MLIQTARGRLVGAQSAGIFITILVKRFMNFIIRLLIWGRYFIKIYKNKGAFDQVWPWKRRNVACYVSKIVRYFFGKSCIRIWIAFKHVSNGDPLHGEWLSSHLKVMEGTWVMKLRANVMGMWQRKCHCKYVTVKATVKFMRRVSLLCCKLGGGEEKRVTRKATRRLKYDFLNHCTLVVYQQKN